MKVTGIGSPARLELRLKPCELIVWREVVARAHAVELDERDAAGREDAVGWRLNVLARLVGEAHAGGVDGQHVRVAGPTSVIAPLVRAAAATALDEYVSTAQGFVTGRPEASPEALRQLLDSAGAWTATLLSLHHVEGVVPA